MLKLAHDDEQLKIRVHHIGGIGESGPVEALGQLGHVEWVFYDAQADSLSSVRVPGNAYRLVHRAIGGTDSHAKFNITEWPSASSLLSPSPAAERYTRVLDDNRAQVWGSHTKVVKSEEMQVSTLDALARNGEIPQIDFLSVDAQGAELSILDGASSCLKDRIIGVLCEVEFTELYESQPLFGDIQNRLRSDHFRLCEIYNTQYFINAPLAPSSRGAGFLTVGEALFLRDARPWVDDGQPLGSPSSDQAAIQALKLAAVAVAFDQLDYAIEICRRLEKMGVLSLDAIARDSDVKYVRMLRDLYVAADSAQRGYSPNLEPPENASSSERKSHPGDKLRIVVGLGRLTLLAFASRLSRRFLAGGFGLRYPATSKILYDYGFVELAVKQAVRSAGIPYLSGDHGPHYLDFITRLLFRNTRSGSG
jgi:FkbM family methyltransferase